MEAPAEEQYSSYLGKVNIILMPHHGINEDAYRPFYTATKPDYAICNYVTSTEDEEWIGIRHKGFMQVKNEGSYIVTNRWSKGNNNIFTFISNGKQVFSNVKGEGLSTEATTLPYIEGKLYRQVEQLINYTSEHQASKITLNELIANMNVGSKFTILWKQEYVTRFSQLHNDLLSIFPKFYYHMIVDIERINDEHDRITVHNNNLKFSAYRQGTNNNWNKTGSGITPSLTSSNFITYLKDLPIGRYICGYFTSSEAGMSGASYQLEIDIIEAGDTIKASLRAINRSTNSSAIATDRLLIGYLSGNNYALVKVI